MKLMIPFTPHLAHECLELLKCNSIDKWPSIKKDILEEIKFAIQVNGKTRDIITIKKNLSEEEVNQLISRTSKVKKFIKNKDILKTIFVKNKIINYIIK
jgi:leucyl-tRNA synthetase